MRLCLVIAALLGCNPVGVQEENAMLRAQLATVRTPPSLERLQGAMAAREMAPRLDGEVVRGACGEGDDRVAITAQVFEPQKLVYLATNGWFRLSETADERGVVVLLTQIASLNHRTADGKIALNPASGEVVLSIELETDDGLGDQTLSRGLERLCRQAGTLRPVLREAVEAGLL